MKPTFPTSTSTGFDDLAKIKAGEQFVLRGVVYQAHSDATQERITGLDCVNITAHTPGEPWRYFFVSESRAYIGTLDEIGA